MAKNVVITGATSGIGEAIARAYLEKGENVVLTGRRTERLKTLKTEFAEAFPNQKVWTFPLDVTDMSMVKTVCSEILETVGQVDILVNNAGLALGLSPYQGLEALQAQDIADTVVYVTSQPRRVQITDMTIMANQQATGFMIHRD